MALFSDEILYAEILGKAAFWLQYQYFGVDITSLHAPSVAGYFSQAGPMFWQAGISSTMTIRLDMCATCRLLWTLSTPAYWCQAVLQRPLISAPSVRRICRTSAYPSSFSVVCFAEPKSLLAHNLTVIRLTATLQ